MALSDLADSKPSPSAKLKITRAACSPSTGQTSHAMTTCEPSQPTGLLPMELPSMSSAVGSRAKICRWQESKLELTESAAAYGRRSLDWLARYDRALSSWRTSQVCFLALEINQASGLGEFLETWPRSGSMRNGTAFQQAPLVPLSAVIGCGLSPGPCRTDFKGGARTRKGSSERRHWWLETFGAVYPCPNYTEAEMGFPPSWSVLPASETPSFRKSQSSSAARSCKPKE